MSQVQIHGTIRIGPVAGTLVDYSNAIRSFLIVQERALIEQPARFPGGTSNVARSQTLAGPLAERIDMEIVAGLESTGLWSELFDAVTSTDPKLDFEAWLDKGATSTTNPKFSGTFRVVGLSTGGVVGAGRVQQVSFPLSIDETGVGVTRATS